MPVTPVVTELFDTRSAKTDQNGRYTEIVCHYNVTNVSNEYDAISAVAGFAPTSINDLPRSEIEAVDRYNNDGCKVDVRYALATASGISIGGSTHAVMNFDCSAGSRHMNVAYHQIHCFGKRNANLLINWNGKTGKEMQVEGIDVVAPSMRVTYNKEFRVNDIDDTEFKRKVAKMVGCVNLNAWKGWNKGEVMFLGCSYSAPVRGHEKVTVTFNFEIRMNEKVIIGTDGTMSASYCDTEFENIIHGNATTGFTGGTIFKTGWDYMYGINNTEVNETTGTIDAKVEDIYLNHVCVAVDFSELGI